MTLRQLGLPADFPQTRIRQGYGDEVCMVLNTLAQQALKATKFKWKRYAKRKNAVVENGTSRRG